MCQRYVSPDSATVEREFDLVAGDWQFADNFNVAPGGDVPVIRVLENQPDPVLLEWGFGAHGMAHVGIETLRLDESAVGVLADAQRCIVPALGFYVWQKGAAERRQAFYVHVEDQEVFGFAGFWERQSCTIITLPAAGLLQEIDAEGARMPAIIARDLRDVWLYGTPARAAAALVPYPDELLVAYKVSARVDALENNDETLIEPLETDAD